MTEPTIADVLARLDLIDRTMGVQALEYRATNAEIAALRAEMRTEMALLRQLVHDLDHAINGLWQEHMLHSHPEGES